MHVSGHSLSLQLENFQKRLHSVFRHSHEGKLVQVTFVQQFHALSTIYQSPSMCWSTLKIGSYWAHRGKIRTGKVNQPSMSSCWSTRDKSSCIELTLKRMRRQLTDVPFQPNIILDCVFRRNSFTQSLSCGYFRGLGRLKVHISESAPSKQLQV